MPKHERMPAAAPAQEYTPRVKTDKGGETLNRNEQFVTKAEAYTGVATRLKEINEAIADIRSGGVPDSKRQNELNNEAKKLIEYLDKMEKGVTEEQAESSFMEGRDILVENPFYEEAEEELGDADIEYVEKKKAPESPSALKERYKQLKAQNAKLSSAIGTLEYAQRRILATIKVLQEPSGIVRDDLNQKLKNREALHALMNDYSDIESEIANTPFVEAVHRKRLQESGLPGDLELISESLEKLGNEKIKVLDDMSSVVDRLNTLGKAEEAAEGKKKTAANKKKQEKAEVEAFEDSFMKSDAEKLEDDMLGPDFSKTNDEEAPPAKSGTRNRKPTKKAA